MAELPLAVGRLAEQVAALAVEQAEMDVQAAAALVGDRAWP